MNKEWEKVREFHKTFEQPAPDNAVMLDRIRVYKRHKWMKEELEEFRKSENIVEQADALIDLIYLALGALVEMGIPPEGLFDIVHEANMDKLWSDGKPHFREDGKTIKPPEWQDPYEDLLEAINSLGGK